ncbi:hypothetical protein BTS2_2180 [Bacillus sp. TS-2]|nr:hypothetical protein BTS2_2180 [Bacillus sp. TS-2]
MYLLDQVKKQQGDTQINRVYLIKDQKVVFVNEEFSKWNKVRVNVSGFTLTAGHVQSEYQLLNDLSDDEFEFRQKTLIEHGCTTVMLFVKIQYEAQIEKKLLAVIEKLKSSTIDYVLGLEIPLRLLRPSVLILCKKLTIPFLHVICDEQSDIEQIPWMYIAQASLSYRVVLMPSFKHESFKEKQNQKWHWQKYTKKYAIANEEYIREGQRWERRALQKVGLYPQKGELLVGSDLDYNLYTADESQLVEGSHKLDYDKRKPSAVILRGKSLKINHHHFLIAGFGQHIRIKMPGRLLSVGN